MIFNRAKTADTTVNEALSLHGKTTEAFRKQQPKCVVKTVKVHDAKMITAEWMKEEQRRGEAHSAECQSVQIFVKGSTRSHAVISDRLVSQSCSTNMSEASSADKMSQSVFAERGQPFPKDVSPTSVFWSGKQSTDLIQRVRLHSSHTCVSCIPHAKALSRSAHAHTFGYTT